MEWGDGHVWSLALDVPVGTEVEFKVRLKRGVLLRAIQSCTGVQTTLHDSQKLYSITS
jgi:hypothetical protein